MPQTEQVAHRLATIQAAREVVPSDPNHSARWHRHGVPSPFSRWNHHPEYEVHLITAGTGWYVVGDRIDVFSAGQLVLVGSNVPHHWISDLAPGERLPERDVVFQFHPQWIDRCSDLLPEVGALRTLLRRSRRGIEFSGPTRDAAAEQLQAIGVTEGAARLGHIFSLLALMSDAPDGERATSRRSGRRTARTKPTVSPTASTWPSATSSPTSATPTCVWPTRLATSACRSLRSPATSHGSPQ